MLHQQHVHANASLWGRCSLKSVFNASKRAIPMNPSQPRHIQPRPIRIFFAIYDETGCGMFLLINFFVVFLIKFVHAFKFFSFAIFCLLSFEHICACNFAFPRDTHFFLWCSHFIHCNVKLSGYFFRSMSKQSYSSHPFHRNKTIHLPTQIYTHTILHFIYKKKKPTNSISFISTVIYYCIIPHKTNTL